MDAIRSSDLARIIRDHCRDIVYAGPTGSESYQNPEAVMAIQTFLHAEGYLVHEGRIVDGSFGPRTTAALAAFMRDVEDWRVNMDMAPEANPDRVPGTFDEDIMTFMMQLQQANLIAERNYFSEASESVPFDSRQFADFLEGLNSLDQVAEGRKYDTYLDILYNPSTFIESEIENCRVRASTWDQGLPPPLPARDIDAAIENIRTGFQSPEDMLALQVFLTEQGTNPAINQDGIWGNITRGALRGFLEQNPAVETPDYIRQLMAGEAVVAQPHGQIDMGDLTPPPPPPQIRVDNIVPPPPPPERIPW